MFVLFLLLLWVYAFEGVHGNHTYTKCVCLNLIFSLNGVKNNYILNYEWMNEKLHMIFVETEMKVKVLVPFDDVSSTTKERKKTQEDCKQ